MSISTDITRLQNAKAAIKTAIEGKGVTVPDATLLDGMAALIESIEAGVGNIETVSFTPASTGAHLLNLETDAIPFVFFCVRDSFISIDDAYYTDTNEVPIACILIGRYDKSTTGTSKGTQYPFHLYNNSSSDFTPAVKSAGAYSINNSISATSSSVFLMRSNYTAPKISVYANKTGSKGLRVGETYTILCLFRS